MKFPLFSSLVLIAALTVGSANASLVGSNVSASGPGLSPASATVGSGVEFQWKPGQLASNVDFGADTLTFTALWGVGWGGFGDFTFSGFDVPITGLSLLSNTGFSGDMLSDFSFTSDSITIHWNNGNASNAGKLVFAISSGANAVPEPGSLALLGLGLAVLAATRKRKLG
ncbi:PEP-CTERM sorting domain-containing protein [Rhodoferax sp. WC2427]|uniref:PEP-CTERM sorting domain-containing protein n=1 Tax=Rhodoferax sp. WC2427 TaxID=3234144 RepID=UPI0034677E99